MRGRGGGRRKVVVAPSIKALAAQIYCTLTKENEIMRTSVYQLISGKVKRFLEGTNTGRGSASTTALSSWDNVGKLSSPKHNENLSLNLHFSHRLNS